jgi:hypothetical protein
MASYEDTLRSFALKGNAPGEVDWVGQRAMTNPSLSSGSFAAVPPEDILTKQTAQTVDMSQPAIGAMPTSQNAALGVGGTEVGAAGAGISPTMAMAGGQMILGALKDVNAANQNRINQAYAAKLAQIRKDQEGWKAMGDVYKV